MTLPRPTIAIDPRASRVAPAYVRPEDAQRNWLRGAGFRGHLALLFADLCDYTVLAERCEPEESEPLLSRIAQLAAQVLGRHGGQLVQVYGDGVFGMFGLPTPTETDSRAVLYAALELHERVRAIDWSALVPRGFEVRLHTGVHSGLVVARAGDALHGSYDLTGDAVNTAARLCAAAGRDEIVASASVLQGIEGFFDIRALPPSFLLKGKQRPVPAYRVTARGEARTRAQARRPRALTPFLGRERELALLTDAVARALVGHQQVIVVNGSAGSGKTRLLDELAARIPGTRARCVVGTCENAGEVGELAPFRQLLRDEGAPVSQVALEGVFAELLGEQPLVLLLDDFHLADAASREALTHLLRMRESRSLCVVLTTRDRNTLPRLPRQATAFTLGPLPEEISRRIVRALRPYELDLSVSRALHQRAGGNPLFLEDLCEALPDRSVDLAELSRLAAPTTIRHNVQARVATLPPEHQRVLSAAAVIGTELSETLLARVIKVDGLERILARLVELGLLVRERVEGFRFAHGIAREVVYESVRKEDRRRGHAAIAQAIADSATDETLETHAEALSHHLRASHDHEQAAVFAELAGDTALAGCALERARAQYRAALTDLDQLPPSLTTKRRWVQVSVRWAETTAHAPAREQLEVLTRATRHADELGGMRARVETRLATGWAHYLLGEYGEATRLFQAALGLSSEAHTSRFTDALWSRLGESLAAAGRYPEALAELNRGLGRARERGDQASAEGVAHALACRAIVHADRGDAPQATADARDAVLALEASEPPHGHPLGASVRCLVAVVAMHMGDWMGCLEAATEALAAAARTGSSHAFAMASAHEAYAQWKLDRHPDALTRLSHAVSFLEERGLGLHLSLFHAALADALCEAGSFEGAEESARKALARASAGDPLGEASACRTLARLCGGDRADAAESWLLRALASAALRRSRRDRALTLALRESLRVRRVVKPNGKPNGKPHHSSSG
ncbi:MAG: AAA family ATPase [Polyangiales bacterium]